MDIFKRITDLLTPPPQKASATSSTEPNEDSPEAEAVPTVNLGRSVKALVSAPALEHPQALEAIAELKQIAATSGLYVVASKVRFQLDAMPRADVSGAINWKDRAYVLAADFIYQHITRDLRAIEAQNRPVGPNIFRSYCNELVACLLCGKNVRRAIELPVLIVEDLLHMAVAYANRRDRYLELADVAANATVTQTMAKLEADQRERNRRRHEDKRGDIPSTPPSDPTARLDSESVLYAKRIQEQLDRIRRELTTIPPVPVPADQNDRAAVLRFADYLRTLIAVADRAAYVACVALLQSHLGGLLARSNAGEAAAHYRQAAQKLETLAISEHKLLFSKLCGRRLARAAELYLLVGDQVAAQKCRTASKNGH